MTPGCDCENCKQERITEFLLKALDDGLTAVDGAQVKVVQNALLVLIQGTMESIEDDDDRIRSMEIFVSIVREQVYQSCLVQPKRQLNS